MASFTDAIPQFNPYIQQLPVEAIVSVGMQKQQQYDQGIQRIQSQIDQVAGLDIVRDVDRQYLQSKLNDLGTKLRTVAAGDFSNFQLVNSVAGMAGKVAKDNTVISAVQSTAKYRKEQTFMEEARQKGESAIQNEYDFMRQTDQWMNDEKVGAGYSGRFKKYTDVDKKWLGIVKDLHSDLLEQDVPYVYNEDGSVNVNQTAATMQRISKESVSAEKIQNALRASLSSDELEQLNINGRYEFRGVQDPGQLATIITTKNASMIQQNNAQIETLKGAMNLFRSDPEKYRKAEEGIKSLEAVNKSIQDEMNYEIDLVNRDPEAAKGLIYKRGAIEQFASAHAWEKQKYNVLTNPAREDEWKAKNYLLNVARESRMQTKDNFDMQIGARRLAIDEAEAQGKLYGTPGFTVTGGASTKVPDQEMALRKGMEEMSINLESGVNTLMNKINASGEGKVDKTQIINALEAYQRGDVSAYESLIPYNLQNVANSVLELKKDLTLKEQYLKRVESEATTSGKTVKEIITGDTGTFLRQEIPIMIGSGEGNQARNTWEGITTSLLRKAGDSSLSGMAGGYEGLDSNDIENLQSWFGEKGGKENINYKVMQDNDKTFLVVTKGNEAFDIPLSQDEVAQLPINMSSFASPQVRKVTQVQVEGRGNTNPSGKYETAYFQKSSMPRVNLKVRGDMVSEDGDSSKQYIVLRLKLPDGTVYPLEIGRDKPQAVDMNEGIKFINSLTDKEVIDLYIDSPRVDSKIKEVIRKM
jgi:hypothetical protein